MSSAPNFDLLTRVMGFVITIDVLVLVINALIRIIKYNRAADKNDTPVQKPKNTVGRVGLIALIVLSICYGTACSIIGFSSSSGFDLEKDSYILWWSLAMILFFILLILVPVLIIKVISTIVAAYKERVNRAAINAQIKTEENKAKELSLFKAKYRPVKCVYCGTANHPKRTNCKNCGATLNNTDNRPLE